MGEPTVLILGMAYSLTTMVILFAFFSHNGHKSKGE